MGRTVNTGYSSDGNDRTMLSLSLVAVIIAYVITTWGGADK